jgi:N-formylglutamate deformylase
MEIFRLHRGSAPLLISLPHDGEHLPAEVVARLTPDARRLPDTDWHVGRLYDFARELGASILRPHYSRYLVDLNRPPDDLSLYPGQNTTGLCPSVQFNGQPVYLDGEAPTPDEIAQRVDRYWRPYHEAVAAELQRLRAEHGRAVLWEGHSIRSVVPYLFDGRLPDFNLGTANGGDLLAGLAAGFGIGSCRAARVFLGRQWTLQGRLHHPPLRTAAGGHRCGAAGAGAMQLHGRRQLRLRRGR